MIRVVVLAVAAALVLMGLGVPVVDHVETFVMDLVEWFLKQQYSP